MKLDIQHALGTTLHLPIRHVVPNPTPPTATVSGHGRVLVSIDFAMGCRPLLRRAAALARETGSDLTLIYVQAQDWIEEDARNPVVAESYRDLGEEAVARLNRLGEEEVEGALELNAEFGVGKWAPTLAEAARRKRTDFIVVPEPEPLGLLARLRAHPAERLAGQAPCPVLVIPRQLLSRDPSGPPPLRQIVVVADLSESSALAVRQAARLALALGRRLVLLHVMPEQGLGTRLNLGHALKRQKAASEHARRTLLGWVRPEIDAGLRTKVVVRAGSSSRRSLERQLRLLHPELVVVGTANQKRRAGSCARTVLRSPFAPVMVVGPQAAVRPLTSAATAPTVPAVAEPAVERRRSRILVVDDDPSVRDSLGQLFQMEGFEVALAGDGQEVIGRVQAGQFDLVLLDLKMRGKNGWATLRYLQSIDPRLPVVLITGLPDRYKLAASAGVRALVEKPLDVTALLETVHELLEPSAGDVFRSGPSPIPCRHIHPSAERIEAVRAG